MSGYITQANYKKAEQVKKPRAKTTRQKKINYGLKAEPFSIKVKSLPSPELSEEESKIISEICADGNVYFKARPTKQTTFSFSQKWQMLFEDIYHYLGWLDFSHLDSEFYSGYDVDVLNYTSSGESL